VNEKTTIIIGIEVFGWDECFTHHRTLVFVEKYLNALHGGKLDLVQDKSTYIYPTHITTSIPQLLPLIEISNLFLFIL